MAYKAVKPSHNKLNESTRVKDCKYLQRLVWCSLEISGFNSFNLVAFHNRMAYNVTRVRCN